MLRTYPISTRLLHPRRRIGELGLIHRREDPPTLGLLHLDLPDHLGNMARSRTTGRRRLILLLDRRGLPGSDSCRGRQCSRIDRPLREHLRLWRGLLQL
jgi:hypothetical protein